MSNQGNALAGAASPLTPAPGTPVGGAQAPAIATAPANADIVTTVPSILCVPIVESNATRTKELTDANWSTWKGSMKHIFGLCDLSEYVLGNVIRPDPAHNPVGAKNWDFNDSYTAMLICENISDSQKVYAGQDNKSYEVWRNLEAIHKVTGNTTIITWIRTLFKCTANEGDDIKDQQSEDDLGTDQSPQRQGFYDLGYVLQNYHFIFLATVLGCLHPGLHHRN
jgi:hypothetical protein